jgi:hypothetical protein
MRLLETYSTDIYVSDVGYLAIKQTCGECGHEPTYLLSPEQTKILFSILPSLMKEQEERWVGVYVSSEQEETDV